MSKLENEVRRKMVLGKVQKVILNSIYAAGFLSVALLAPNALRTFRDFGAGKKKKNFIYRVESNLNKLKSKGLIYINEKNFVCLTPDGNKIIQRVLFEKINLKKPKRWDGKWRIISFDIKERRRQTRDQIRTTLRRLDFIKIHQSMWVYPYDCEDFILLLKSHFHVGKDLIYIIADKIENDRPLKYHYKLK